MGWIAYLAYSIMAGAAVYGASETHKAGKEAKEIAAANARREKAEADEAARKLKLSQDQILSETRARASASGISSGSSTVVSYIDEMKKNFKDEQDWIKKSGASAAAIQSKQGEYQSRMANASSWGTLSSVAGSFTSWG